MELAEQHLEFLRVEHSAAMITIGSDGMPKVARVGVALVDGRLRSSGKQGRVRTGRLRRDPRCTLYVHSKTPDWLGLETSVVILDGPDAPRLNLELFRVMQGRPTGPMWWYGEELEEDAFLERMAAEERLIYEFDIQRIYGPRP